MAPGKSLKKFFLLDVNLSIVDERIDCSLLHF